MEPYAAGKGGGGGGGADGSTGLEGTVLDLRRGCFTPARADGDVAADAFAESMRRMGLGGDGEAGDAKLPERPGEVDCAYYLRTGACGYGEQCRYNTPRPRSGRPGEHRFIHAVTSPVFCSVLFCFRLVLSVCGLMELKGPQGTVEYPERQDNHSVRVKRNVPIT
ncbi:hypothetical protein HU200_005752 [Digitaria exilis]|uniref:C3H1-type domain-containing protein n=1 Tax=Digitaria exilis TaxID=1010633 RepID=A0A835FSP2_9POAL|nr:hypothetical protein HU200_005752 [Digitaria exilis]